MADKPTIPQKWDYDFLEITTPGFDPNILKISMKALGQNGWECATAFSVPNTIRETPRTFLVFKRPLETEQIESAEDLATQASPPYCPSKKPEDIHGLT